MGSLVARRREWMKLLVATLFIFNAVDAIATVIWVSTGHATEANPLMAHLLELHPAVFVATKVALVGLCSFLLWRHWDRTLSVVATIFLVAVYYSLLVYHLSFPSYLAWTMLLG